MRYLIIVALIMLGISARAQPYPVSSWPDPLPTSNLKMVEVMDWMMRNGEIDRLDLFVSNSGIGQYIRKPISMVWLYGKSRLVGTPIMLSSWAGYAVVPSRISFSSSLPGTGTISSICASPMDQTYYYGSTGGKGDFVYRYATGDEKINSVSSGIRVIRGGVSVMILLLSTGEISETYPCP